MIYLSHLISSESPIYGDYSTIEIQPTNSIKKGDTSNNCNLSLTSHSGTHVDAPYHFDEKGKVLDSYLPEFWTCNHPFVIEQRAEPGEIISIDSLGKELEKIPVKTDLLLIKTGFERYRSYSDACDRNTYIFEGPGIAPEIGIWLRENRRLKFIGFDFISLTSFQNRELGRIAHRAFLSSTPDGCSDPFSYPPILIIEDMKLSGLSSIPTRVTIAPLLYVNADGAPVTVFAEMQ